MKLLFTLLFLVLIQDRLILHCYNNTAEYIWNLSLEYGFEEEQAAAILATIYTESGFNPGTIGLPISINWNFDDPHPYLNTNIGGYMGMWQIHHSNWHKVISHKRYLAETGSIDWGIFGNCFLGQEPCASISCFSIFCRNQPLYLGGRRMYTLSYPSSFSLSEWQQLHLNMVYAQFDFVMTSDDRNNLIRRNWREDIKTIDCVETAAEAMLVYVAGRVARDTDYYNKYNWLVKFTNSNAELIDYTTNSVYTIIEHPVRSLIAVSSWGNSYQSAAKQRAVAIQFYNHFSSNTIEYEDIHPLTREYALYAGIDFYSINSRMLGFIFVQPPILNLPENIPQPSLFEFRFLKNDEIEFYVTNTYIEYWTDVLIFDDILEDYIVTKGFPPIPETGILSPNTLIMYSNLLDYFVTRNGDLINIINIKGVDLIGR